MDELGLEEGLLDLEHTKAPRIEALGLPGLRDKGSATRVSAHRFRYLARACKAQGAGGEREVSGINLVTCRRCLL